MILVYIAQRNTVGRYKDTCPDEGCVKKGGKRLSVDNQGSTVNDLRKEKRKQAAERSTRRRKQNMWIGYTQRRSIRVREESSDVGHGSLQCFLERNLALLVTSIPRPTPERFTLFFVVTALAPGILFRAWGLKALRT